MLEISLISKETYLNRSCVDYIRNSENKDNLITAKCALANYDGAQEMLSLVLYNLPIIGFDKEEG